MQTVVKSKVNGMSFPVQPEAADIASRVWYKNEENRILMDVETHKDAVEIEPAEEELTPYQKGLITKAKREAAEAARREREAEAAAEK